MPRRPHPYFGFRPRIAGEDPPGGGGRSPHEPTLTPTEEEGVLWTTFRRP